MSNEQKPLNLRHAMDAMKSVELELARRDPVAFAAAAVGGGRLKLLLQHEDLTQIFRARIAELENTVVTLAVKKGDWVTINEARFRIGHADPNTGIVLTERVRVDGAVLSGVPIDGTSLVPDSTEPTPDELEPIDREAARQRQAQWRNRNVPPGASVDTQIRPYEDT